MKMPNEAIREEIRRQGWISFARFMEIALYCPETGYYETEKDIVGSGGDFITNVSVGSLFGELLAFQFAKWLEKLRVANSELRIVEAGAHDGRLASDILSWLQRFQPKLFSEIEYLILEPSATRRAWQQKTLGKFSNVRWLQPFNDSTLQHVNGIIFSNELLDAFPVHRFGWDAREKKWFEWGVALEDKKFSWAKKMDPNEKLPSFILDLPSSLLDVLPDGYIFEDSPAAEAWWREAAKVLSHGKLLTIDYGFTTGEQLSPARLNGTLRAYHRHRVSDDLLANPGEQDLTAHVNFPAIQRTGEAVGLATAIFCTQPQFLTGILSRAVKETVFASLDAKQVRQFQTLTHPEHLGRAFRVLVQAR